MSKNVNSEAISPPRNNLIKNFVAGGFGGACLVASGHPLDLIKVRLQTQPSPPVYRGMVDCIIKTMKGEGFRGLYKGMAAPLTAITPANSLAFFGYGCGKNLMLWAGNKDTLSYSDIFIAGMTSGLMMDALLIPVERVKCLLQIQTESAGKARFAGPLDCVRQLYRSQGVNSIFKGGTITMLRDIPGSGFYFLTYEFLLNLLKSANETREKVNPLKAFFAGGFSGMVLWIVVIAPDTLKSRLQTAPPGKYSNIREVYRDLVKTEGHRALFKGLVPVMTRAFPANACCFLGFELSMRLFNYLFPDSKSAF